MVSVDTLHDLVRVVSLYTLNSTVFLSGDTLVKLDDFGLFKILLSHNFASP